MTRPTDRTRRPRRAWLGALPPGIGVVALLALVLATGLTDDALAAGSASDVGKNLGGLLKQWATWLFGGATAIIAVAATLFGTALGANGWLTLGWCAGIAVVSWVWARHLYERKSVRS